MGALYLFLGFHRSLANRETMEVTALLSLFGEFQFIVGRRGVRCWSPSPFEGCLNPSPLTDKLSRKMPLLVGSFCCILCQTVEEDLDHVLWSCDFAVLSGLFFHVFGFQVRSFRDCRDMIKEFFLHPPFCDKGEGVL